MKKIITLISIVVFAHACTFVTEVSDVKLDKQSLKMTPGQVETITATVSPADATYDRIVWSSNDNSVVSVSDGTITAHQAGSAAITAMANGVASSPCSVVVEAILVSQIKLNRTSLILTEGESFLLSASTTPNNASIKTVTWTSNNSSIATVSPEGLVRAVKVGTTNIICESSDGNASATCPVTVKTHVTGVSLDKTSLSMTVGDTQTLTATITPSNATDKSVTWSSSNNSIATISSSGVVTAKAVGSATITVTTNDGGKTASCHVSIKVIDVESIEFDKAELELFVGKSETLSAIIKPENATNKDIVWASSNNTVATVNNGLVTGKSEGYTTITATVGNKKASCEVFVIPPDYIDASGNNQGKGICIDGVLWAPVNCGYESTAAPRGRYYQWGRKYGQIGESAGHGFSAEDLWTGVNGEEDPNTVYSYRKDDLNSPAIYKNDWIVNGDNHFWNSGTEDNPQKTIYDPCPDGWRVPTYKELDALCKNRYYEAGEGGVWVSGSIPYSSDLLEKVFLPSSGARWRDGYFFSISFSGLWGAYWTSKAYDNGAVGHVVLISTTYGFSRPDIYRANSCTIRCVHE
ncbi:MAG: Ig-like domain-containing protein [Bacteroidales bacterium]|nr:Ig-like domain-containing protein [Bacteroidales bacterium]